MSAISFLKVIWHNKIVSPGGFEHSMIWRSPYELEGVWTPSTFQHQSGFSLSLLLASPCISRECLYWGARGMHLLVSKPYRQGIMYLFVSHGLFDNLYSEELAAQFSSCQLALESR